MYSSSVDFNCLDCIDNYDNFEYFAKQRFKMVATLPSVLGSFCTELWVMALALTLQNFLVLITFPLDRAISSR